MDETVKRKIDDFFGKYPLKKFEKKEIIIYAGEEPAGIYNVVSGEVRQYDINLKGSEQVLNVFKPPAFFPMSWAVNKNRNRYFFEAYTPVEVRVAPLGDTLEFLRQNNDVMFDLLMRVYVGLQGVQRRMVMLMGGDVLSRVTFEIILECRRFGELQKDGSYILNMHEDELANRAGLTRETVSRQLQVLKSKNLISVNHKSIKIKSLAGLEKEIE